jgi:hypothetical protein
VEKKLICKLDKFILVLFASPLYRPQNNGIALPPLPPNWHTSSLYSSPLQMPVFGWLLCEPLSIGSRPKATVYFIYIFFHRLNSSPQMIGRPHPTHSNPHAPPLQHLSYHGRQQLFDCYIFQLNGGHLRPRHHFPSIFLMRLNFASQTGEPAIAPPNLITGALHGARGRGGTIGWWCR